MQSCWSTLLLMTVLLLKASAIIMHAFNQELQVQLVCSPSKQHAALLGNC
jgi:hypothetical protein